MLRKRGILSGVGFLFFGLSFQRCGDGFEGRLILHFEHVLKRALTFSVAILHKLHAGYAGNKRHRTERPEGAVSMDTFSMSKPFDLIVRKSCSITQRRR